MIPRHGLQMDWTACVTWNRRADSCFQHFRRAEYIMMLHKVRVQSTVGVRLLTQGTDHSEYLNSAWCWIHCQMLNQSKSKTKEQGTGPGIGNQQRLGTSVRDRDFQGKRISPCIKVSTSSFHGEDWQRLQLFGGFYIVLNGWLKWTKLNNRGRVNTMLQAQNPVQTWRTFL